MFPLGRTQIGKMSRSLLPSFVFSRSCSSVPSYPAFPPALYPAYFAPSRLIRNVCLVLGVVAVLSVAQVGTGLAMVGTWAALKNALERVRGRGGGGGGGGGGG
jgi:hypothetical protein